MDKPGAGKCAAVAGMPDTGNSSGALLPDGGVGPMSSAHVRREKVSFDSTDLTTYLAHDRTGEQAMWLKGLLQWLDRRLQIAEERRAEEHRARQECREVALRNAQVTPWYLPPS